MTQNDPATFDPRQAASLDFEQTQCPDIPRPNRRKAIMKLLAEGDFDNSIKEAEQAIDEVHRFELVKFIDIRIRAHAAEGRYAEALEAASEMRKYASKNYYGYLREAQIHLIQENYAKALKAYAKGIDNVTQRDQVSILNHSINDCLSILDRTASAFGHQRNFNEGQRVARLMIKLLPTSPAGYLRSGTLYLMHGKEAKAKKVYEKGIASVPPTWQYSLINRKNHVLRRLKPEDPFFFHAPWNVGSLIFQFLDAQDLAICMTVSSRWREVILHIREVWRDLTIRGEFDIYAIRDAWRFVEKLHIQDSCSCVVRTFLKLIMNGSFESLETLVIDSIDPPNDIICVKPFTLEKSIGLRIESINKVTIVPLLGTPPQGVYRKKLKSCAGNCNENCEGHLRICSHIQSIMTAHIPHATRTAIRLCPNLSDLVAEKSWASIFDKKISVSDRRNTVKNLKHLKIQRIDAVDDIYPFIDMYINSLQTLTLANDSAFNENQQALPLDWRGIPDIASNTLTKLVISSQGDDSEPKQWIDYCPALEEVTLRDMALLDESVFRALKRLPVLRRLELRSCACAPILRFESFFDLLENKRNIAQLDTLVLHNFKNLENSSLSAISRYRNIRKLVIAMCPHITGEGIENFSIKAGANPNSQLETLVISGIKEVSDQTAILVASNLSRLKSLTFDSLDNITDEAIVTIAMVAKGTELEVLKVLRCKQVTQAIPNEPGTSLKVLYDTNDTD